MANAESLLNLESDQVAVEKFLKENDGHLMRDEANPALYWLSMRPRSAPSERYHVRVLWTSYPDAAPSILFSDGVGGALGVMHAWPVIPGYRPPNDICKPFTAEGFSLHAEWQSGPDAWPTDGNPFVWVAEVLQNDLNTHYTGRAG